MDNVLLAAEQAGPSQIRSETVLRNGAGRCSGRCADRLAVSYASPFGIFGGRFVAHHDPPGYPDHYVPKSRLHGLIHQINDAYLSTLAACGDVVRNVISCPAPFESDSRRDLQPYIAFLSKSLKPRTTAYYEIWVNGGKVSESSEPTALETGDQSIEPLYGPTYLPRKFKIGLHSKVITRPTFTPMT